jgi:hypothetical protein
MRNKIVVSVVLTISLSAVIIAFADRHSLLAFFKPKHKLAPAINAAAYLPKKYDEGLLAKLNSILNVFDEQRRSYTIAGTINTLDKADTSEKMNSVSFQLCKDGSDFYYKMGTTEAISEKGIYININEETKKVFITEGKQAENINMINIKQLKSVLQTEEYDLLSKDDGQLETISLVNEHHFTCKEYAVTFDTTSKKLTNIFYRLAYFREPMNKNKEKLINIKLTVCDTVGDIGLYNTKSKIINEAGKLTAKYSEYKLVHL